MKMVKWRKSFKKDYKRLDKKQKRVWSKALKLFLTNPHHKSLRRHSLKGEYKGLESIYITPDLRVLFYEDETRFTFYFLRNHNQLYS